MSSVGKVALQLGLLVCLGVCQLASACPSQTLDKIDLLLRERVHSTEVGANIRQLEEYLRELSKTSGSGGLDSGLLVSFLVQNIIEASEVSQSARCDYHEFELLSSLDLSIYGKPFEVNRHPDKCLQRIRSIFNTILAKYFELCERAHKKRLLEAYERVDIEARDRTEWLVDSLSTIASQQASQSTLNALTTILQHSSLLDRNSILAISEVLKTSASDWGADVGKIVRGGGADKWREPFYAFLYRHCQELVQETDDFGPPASLDILFQGQALSDEQTQYFAIVGADHVCKILIREKRQIIEALAREVV